MTASSKSGQTRRPEDAHLLFRSFVSIWLILLIGRAFLVEPNQIPTGSMAPFHKGRHIDYTCNKCNFHFVTGVLPDGNHGKPVCPNCGTVVESPATDLYMLEGDRVWVSKSEFEFHQPERFDEVVFYSPDAPLTAHLKRIVGLPGEKIQIREGDLFINNQRLKKSMVERRRLGILVFDQKFPTKAAFSFSRWQFPGVNQDELKIADDSTIQLSPAKTAQKQPLQVNYLHLSPDRGDYAPVDDFLAYNGRQNGIGHEVGDLWFVATVEFHQLRNLGLRLTNRDLNIEIQLKRDNQQNQIEFKINNEMIIPSLIHQKNETPASGTIDLELSIVDHQLQFLINHESVIEPFNLDNFSTRMPDERLRYSPAGFLFDADKIQLRNFCLYRDIYYTDRLAEQPIKGIAVDEPLSILPDHYFVLGDNSPMSIDSRFWQNGPLVHRSSLIGQPINLSK